MKKIAELMAPLEGAMVESISVTAYEASFLKNLVGE